MSVVVYAMYQVVKCIGLLIGVMLPVLLRGQQIEGDLQIWHALSLTFDGPYAGETSAPNPFSDYRLEVTFTHDSVTYVVPGYFAADGNAAESGADAGDQWRVLFTPDRVGLWIYTVSFVSGQDVAITADAGTPEYPDGVTGNFVVLPGKDSSDLRERGRLVYVGKGYLWYAGSGTYFLQSGADSPETLLAYRDFDQTQMLKGGSALKDWSPHVQDWRDGDPVWRDSLGKGIIGAVNYMAEEGQNIISFLTMNIEGDGRNVWPYIDSATFDRFDCSKLDQWDILFSHCDVKGVVIHIKTQEQENDQLLDGGDLGRMRKLYYRQLIARFAYHLGVVWNLGEENTNTDAQRKAFAQYFSDTDPYKHPVVVHTMPGADADVYTPLLGDASAVSGASLQVDWDNVHALTRKWVRLSRMAGKPWIVTNDEQGTAFIGVPDDSYAGSPSQDDIRKQVLWGSLMAGGAGVAYFFGYALPENDLNCEDFRSREHMWGYNRVALDLFHAEVPFWLMLSADSLITQDQNLAFCLSLSDSIYLAYLPAGGMADIDLSAATGTFSIMWYNPRTGGPLQMTADSLAFGGQKQSIGPPPAQPDEDWAVLLRKRTPVHLEIALDCAPWTPREDMLWLHDVPDGEYIVESSGDGMVYSAIDTLMTSHCAGYCNIAVPAIDVYTYYRVIHGPSGSVSNTVRCHSPIVSKEVLLPAFEPPKRSGQ